VVENEEEKIFDEAGGKPIFSNDSTRCAAMLKDGEEWMVFERGKK